MSPQQSNRGGSPQPQAPQGRRVEGPVTYTPQFGHQENAPRDMNDMIIDTYASQHGIDPEQVANQKCE